MNITYMNPGYQAMIDSIMLFQTPEETSFWSDSLFYFYPTLDKDIFKMLNYTEKEAYLFKEFEKIYLEQKPVILEKVNLYNSHWNKHKTQIEEALTEAFDLDVRPLFNDLRGEITLNPISPRFLKEHYFQIFYLNSERGALGESLHEIIHFLWFHVWNEHFKDSFDEYERPSLKWILSEMVVESIMRDERLSSINPYFPRENGGCVYPYFQNMIIDGRFILEQLDEWYQSRETIQSFMEESFAYCQKHEKSIRSHIHKAEGSST